MVFVDEVFPADKSSLCFEPDGDKLPDHVAECVSWKRPSQWCKNCSLFVDSVNPGDIEQAQLGDCWLLSAMAVTAQFPEILQKLFVEVNETEGRYVIRLYYENKWQNVTVDDRIPCGRDGLPCYGRCTSKNEFWVSILEKAVAKLLGSYEALDGGYLEEGVVMLTGGRPERLYINNWSQNPGKQPWRKDRLWEKLVLYKSENVMMGSSISSNRGEQPNETKGLVAGHAYSILDVRETSDKKYKLIKLKNPWANDFGAWSDTSRNWTYQYKKEMGEEVKADGIFWMEFKDFCTYYDKITCCRLFNDSILSMPSDPKYKTPITKDAFPSASWNRKKLVGQWDNENAGGMTNNIAFAKNPHFRLTAQKSGRYFLIIYRAYLSLDADAQYYRSGIGFAVYKGTDSNYKVLPAENSPNAIMQYPVYGRYNSIELDLDQGEYVITPCTLYSNRKGEFVFEVYSACDFDIQPMEDKLRIVPPSARGKAVQDFGVSKPQPSQTSFGTIKIGNNTIKEAKAMPTKASNMMTTYQFEFSKRKL
ncbi:hypothetical protein FDP41_011983 [Naegleria fowleri]|uniref:Calpain catalytic domain-containing protein n=1 Tax=Naegleria fowleri TaxID=5763 RepID=A0A6A5C5N9_NAEFO|nr:uncharacterized protein FDP41_011983 [Naegleria fowleri]KAF0982122.1 hypothetical protein FDP41_011983 [Naegleria fowleri]